MRRATGCCTAPTYAASNVGDTANDGDQTAKGGWTKLAFVALKFARMAMIWIVLDA